MLPVIIPPVSTGVLPGEGTGATMSDNDDDQDSDTNLYDASLEGPDRRRQSKLGAGNRLAVKAD
ncbi:hypothetical protein IFM89_035737 [Coptis chinensis]|uniref:Uncharacterized protein n=1 Tax=Coptis chinensis TaxID=261450 RepID=A0A835LCL4_9MAGN|nr:hypothetical protein IFM89_035737 [Coptis chinensis]